MNHPVRACLLTLLALAAIMYWLLRWPTSDRDSYVQCTSSHSESRMQCDYIKTGGGIDMGGGLECRPVTEDVCDTYRTYVCTQWHEETNFAGGKRQACSRYE